MSVIFANLAPQDDGTTAWDVCVDPGGYAITIRGRAKDKEEAKGATAYFSRLMWEWVLERRSECRRSAVTANEERPTVTVDRAYYAAVTRAIRAATFALQPGLPPAMYDPSPEQLNKARRALWVLWDRERWEHLPKEIGACDPPLDLGEVDSDEAG